MKRLILLAICLVLLSALFAKTPVSQDADILESLPNGEVNMRATGIYYSHAETMEDKQDDVKKNGVALAIEDAKMAAIFALLYTVSNPILSTNAYKMNFEQHNDFVYEKENIDKYILFVDKNPPRTTSLDDGQGIQISTFFTVDRNALLADLQKRGIFADNKITEAVKPQQKPPTSSIDRQQLRSAIMKAIADVPSKSIIAVTDIDISATQSMDDVDLPDLLIDVLIERNYRTIDPDRILQIKEDNKLSNTLSTSGQIDLGIAAGASYIINVLASETNLRIQCINVETGTIEGRGTMDL